MSKENGMELEKTVNALIKEGWIPLGGVSVSVLYRTWEDERKGYQESAAEWIYAQAMMRTPNELGGH